jgi:hypothetical protein
MQWPKEKGKTMIYKAVQRKLRIEQHEPNSKSRVNKSGAPKGMSNPTGVTSRRGTAYLSEHLTCSPLILNWVRVAQSLVFSVVLCRSLFFLFLLAIALSVLNLRIMMAHLVSSIFLFVL